MREEYKEIIIHGPNIEARHSCEKIGKLRLTDL